jgi:hypothetical protein
MNVYGAPDRIRTCGLCLRRAALYPAELQVPVSAILISRDARNRKSRSGEEFVAQFQRIYQHIDLCLGIVHPE